MHSNLRASIAFGHPNTDLSGTFLKPLRAWIFSVFWWAGFVVKAALCKRLPVPVNILAAIVL